MLKKENGVTFILLVVTMVVLVILGTAAAAAGISTYKESKVELYLKEMDAIKEKVSLYAEKAEVNSNLDLANLGTPAEDKEASRYILEKVVGASEDSYEDYRYLVASNVASELGLENAQKDIVINIKSQKVYSIIPVQYNNELFYSADDLRDSLK